MICHDGRPKPPMPTSENIFTIIQTPTGVRTVIGSLLDCDHLMEPVHGEFVITPQWASEITRGNVLAIHTISDSYRYRVQDCVTVFARQDRRAFDADCSNS